MLGLVGARWVLLGLVGASLGIGGCGLGIDPFAAQSDEVRTYDFPACLVASGSAEDGTLRDDTGTASVTVEGGSCRRSFTLTSSASRRDDIPSGPRVLTEEGGAPSVQTTNPLFDALYQLALVEAKENSVAAIRDWSFNDGAAVPCPEGGCFETGRKWNYVWTRDTAYAANLGLGWVDPIRAKNSLAFKLSERRDGTDVQIVQDTGTGGSYPISTDRAVWALGAGEILQHLTGAARTQFRDRAYVAARNTALHDREVVFDPADGLYRGEQSFLDWRAQTYPGWTVPNTVHIGMSKSLSTNLAHLALVDLVASLAKEKNDGKTAKTMAGWAADLRRAIRKGFWLPAEKLLATYRTTALDPSPAERFDLLGTSLAVLLDATNAEEARAVIAGYPTLPKGPPVVFPEQQETAIYHNRAIWPFVTGYWAKAARKVGNDAAFDVALRSLVRGAALNLSNMENLEVVTGRPWVDDGPYSGPVVNSQRQLWSVAAYIGAITGSLFGVEAETGGVRVAPFVTRGTHRGLFGGATSIVLNDLPLRGKRVTVVLRLPESADGGGVYRVVRARFNGEERAEAFASDEELGARNLFEFELGAPAANATGATVRTIEPSAVASDYRRLYAPRTPAVSLEPSGDGVRVRPDFAGEAPSDLSWSVFRDGVRIATGLSGTDFLDRDADTDRSHCYAVATVFRSSGNTSQHSEPRCSWGQGNERITTLWAGDFDVRGGRRVDEHGYLFHAEWGDPDHALHAAFTASRSGPHLVQALYGNGAGGLDTGITCAVKKVSVEDVTAGGGPRASGFVVMPQRGSWSSWGDSSLVRVELEAGHTYRIGLTHDARSVNMSAFRHFDAYTGGTGGRGGAFHRVNIAALKVLAL